MLLKSWLISNFIIGMLLVKLVKKIKTLKFVKNALNILMRMDLNIKGSG